MPERPVLPAAIVSGYKRQRVIATVCEAMAEDHGAPSVTQLVAGAALARKTFYDLFGSRDAAIDQALRWGVNALLDVAEDEGVDGIVGWCAANPAAAQLVLLRGPGIDGKVYAAGVEDAAALLGGGDVALAIVGGALGLVAKGLRNGRKLDAALIGEAVEWAAQFNHNNPNGE